VIVSYSHRSFGPSNLGGRPGTGFAFSAPQPPYPVLAQPTVHRCAANAKYSRHNFRALPLLHAPDGTFPHGFERLVIQFPRIVFLHVR
jgi:hypothetical protein